MIGTQNVIEVAIDEEVEKLITISTDKAVNPVNVMGATKLLAERLTISANYYKGHRKTTFSCVRFGNVLGSRGSVVPLFNRQIEKSSPLTITDPKMTRFIMSLRNAVDLVLKATELAQGGEIFIFKMPKLRIIDLAECMLEESVSQRGNAAKKVEVEMVGKRAGEKNYEELMTEDEAMTAYEMEDMFIIVPSQKKNEIAKEIPVKKYTSRDGDLLTKEQIKKMLREILH